LRLTVATWSGTTTWSLAAGSSQASSTPASELCRSATAEKKPTIRSIIARGIFGYATFRNASCRASAEGQRRAGTQLRKNLWLRQTNSPSAVIT